MPTAGACETDLDAVDQVLPGIVKAIGTTQPEVFLLGKPAIAGFKS
jgi:hypothetical protein